VQSLLEEHNTLDVNQPGPDGWTLLHVSAWQGDKRTAKVVLRRGARMDTKNPDGVTAIELCEARGHHELRLYLESKVAGAQTPPATARDRGIDMKQACNGQPLHRPERVSQLMSAVRHGRIPDVEAALAQGVSVNLADPDDGNTLLHMSAQNGKAKLAVLLCGIKADVSALNAVGKTALECATQFRYCLAGASQLHSVCTV